MTDIIDKLEDLIVQATKERSHYYVASCAKEAVSEIKMLRLRIKVAIEIGASLMEKK